MDQELDDLFGDSATLNLPPGPPVQGLRQRVDELHVHGCRQKLAWSKSGCVSYITSDGRSVRLANLRYHIGKGVWEADSHVDNLLVDQISRFYKGRELAHLSWSPTGNELAISDIYGRLCIFANVISLNRINPMKGWINEPEDDLNAMVAMIWLNTERQIPVHRSAMKSKEGQWIIHASSFKAKGPYNPSGRSALLTVTRNGILRLVYQLHDQNWQDIREELQSCSTSLDLLTHAAICQDKDDTIPILVHTSSRQLRLYRLTIDWHHPGGGPGISATQPATFIIQHLKTVDYCCPMMTGEIDSNSNFLMIPLSDAQLSHLEILPKQEIRNKDDSYLTIIAAFSYLAPLNYYHNSELREEAFTVISRWHVQSEKTSFHSSFDTLASKKANSSTDTELKQDLSLRRLDDIHVDRVLIHIQQTNLSNIIVLAYSDGGVEFRDRFTLQGIQDDGPIVPLGLSQNGFGFTDVQQCLHIAFSPNACTKLSLGTVDELNMGVVQSLKGTMIALQEDSFIERTVMAFVLQMAFACMNSNNSDDLLMTIQLFLRQIETENPEDGQSICRKIEQDFLVELYRALSVNLDMPSDIQTDRILRNPWIQRCFSLQAAISYKGEKENRNITSKIAWIFLNLRQIFFYFTFAFADKNDPALNKPEIFVVMVDLAVWSMDLMDYIVDQLFELQVLLSPLPALDPMFLHSKIQSSNSLALVLLLSSTSRLFLRYNCRGLRGLRNLARNRLTQDPASSSSIALSSYALLAKVKASHVSPDLFEKILSEAESGIRKIYQGTNNGGMGSEAESVSESGRQGIERRLFIEGIIPDALVPVVQRLLSTGLDTLRAEIDQEELYFKDFSVLGLGDDMKGKRWRRENFVDAVRKVVVRKGVKTRTCTRCGSIMEDLAQTRGATPWLLTIQRGCFCGGSWMVEG